MNTCRKMESLNRVVFTAVVALGCLGWSPQARSQTSVLDVGVLNGGGSSFGYGISDSGRVAGDTDSRGFRTGKNLAINDYSGSPDNLHATLQGLLAVVNTSRAFDIKQSSTSGIEIVGDSYDITNFRPFWYFESSNGTRKAARILHDGVGAGLAVVGGPDGGYASAVVGFARFSGIDNAAYWSVSTNQHSLYNYGNYFFPGTNSYATDTDGSRTVGYFGNSGVYKAFLLDGSIRSLSTPTNSASAALGMKTVGSTNQVVGYYVDGSGLTKPILWKYTGSGNSTYTTLSLPAGKTQGAARGVNDLGDVVGSVWSSDTSDEVACVWPTGGVYVLNSISGDANWNLIRAYKINSDSAGRKIVGYGVRTIGGVGYTRAFVLSSWD